MRFTYNVLRYVKAGWHRVLRSVRAVNVFKKKSCGASPDTAKAFILSKNAGKLNKEDRDFLYSYFEKIGVIKNGGICAVNALKFCHDSKKSSLLSVS